MNPRTTLLTLVGALALGALAWFMLRPARTPAAWLTVDAPRLATAGRPLTVRVTTNAATPPGMVTVDLHWTTVHDEHRGFLSGAPEQRATAGNSTLTFSLAVPARDELASVRAVIYAGPTHRWEDRVLAATSDPLRVVPTAKFASDDGELRGLAVFDQRPDPAVVRLDSKVVRGIIAFVWTVCGVGWWWRGVQSRPVGSANRTAGAAWRAPAFGCLMAAVWESVPLEVMIGDLARNYFVAQRWYGGRAGLQLALTCGIVVVFAVFGQRVWHCVRDWAGRCTWMGLGFYAALTLASLLSLHEVDALLATRVVGLSALQFGQFIAAGIALAGTGGTWLLRAVPRPE